MNKGITDPLLATTFPYRSARNRVLYFSALYSLTALMNSFSMSNFVAPYNVDDSTALSVLKFKNFFGLEIVS